MVSIISGVRLMKYVVLLVWLVLYLQSGVSSDWEIFAYFKLSMVWVPSFCSNNDCAIVPLSAKFSMHGLWPGNYPGTGRVIFPSYCDRRAYYSIITDPDLFPRMNIYWPNLFDGRRFNQRLWKFNWDKHGTCSLVWYFQAEYFTLAMDLFDNFDVLAHLLEKGIVPTNNHTYSVDRIRLVITQLTGKEPDLYCNNNNQHQHLQLLEIRLCYTPGGEIDDCDPAILAHTCYGQIIFPDLPGRSK